MRFGVGSGIVVVCGVLAGVAACIGDSSNDGPSAGTDAGDGSDATSSPDDASNDGGGTDGADAGDASTVLPCKSESSTRTVLAETADAGLQFVDLWMTHLSPARIAVVTRQTGQGKSLLLYNVRAGRCGRGQREGGRPRHQPDRRRSELHA